MSINKLLFWGAAMTALMSSILISSMPDENLHIITCDVGQGDASLIIYKQTQIIIDGGPPNGNLDTCIGHYVPYWDRTIELVVVTHPQLDHFGGLIHVLSAYKVDTVLLSELNNGTVEYGVLINQVGVSGARIITPDMTTSIEYGLLQLDILWPTREFVKSNSSVKESEKHNPILGGRETTDDLNDFSIVLNLKLGEFDALFTGDIGPAITEMILRTQKLKDVDYIKVPHHGSKNGLTKNLLRATTPEVGVISVGQGNQFGHPHKEVLELLRVEGVKTFRTDEVEDIKIVTDGDNYWLAD